MTHEGGDPRADFRRRFRRRRASETPETRAAEAVRIASILAGHRDFPRLRCLAGYLADDGEADPGPFLEQAHRQGIGLSLPAPVGHVLRFLTWLPNEPLRPGPFGIPIPAGGRVIDPADLDWVLVPLVAFTARGQRLGRGGGFYDRTFAHHTPGVRPLLIGIAYGWQEVEHLPPAPWDVDLDAVVTPEGWRDCPPAGGERNAR